MATKPSESGCREMKISNIGKEDKMQKNKQTRNPQYRSIIICSHIQILDPSD